MMSALDLYRSAVGAVHAEVRNALANWGIVRAAAQEAKLPDRVSGTLHSGYAAQTIRNSCTGSALLAAARLWDESVNTPLCTTAANPRRTPELAEAIASVLERAGVSASDAESRITACSECATRQRRRAHRGRNALRRVRNRWLAHRQISPPNDGGTHYHDDGGADFPTIDFLNLVYRAHIIASGADRLLVPDAHLRSFRALRAEFVTSGRAFWTTYVAAPRVLDDLGRPI